MGSSLNIDLADKNGFYLDSIDMYRYFFFLQAAKTEVKASDPAMGDIVNQKAIASELFTAEELAFMKDNLPTFTEALSINLDTLQNIIRYVKSCDEQIKEGAELLDYEGKFDTISATEVYENGVPALSLRKDYPRAPWWPGNEFDISPATYLERRIDEILEDYGIASEDVIVTFSIEDAIVTFSVE